MPPPLQLVRATHPSTYPDVKPVSFSPQFEFSRPLQVTLIYAVFQSHASINAIGFSVPTAIVIEPAGTVP